MIPISVIFLNALILHIFIFDPTDAYNIGRPEDFTNDVLVQGVHITMTCISLLILVLLAILLSCNCCVVGKKVFVQPCSKPCGLKNTEETCYMNSMIQALASSQATITQYNELVRNRTNLIKSFIELLNGINTEPHDVDKSTAALIGLMKVSNWNKTSQQDSFQLLSCLINAMQKELKDTIDFKEETMPLKIKILHTFTEHPGHNKVHDHLGLSIPLCGDFRKKPGVKIEELLDAFFEPSLIDDGPHSTQPFIFKEVPKVLILHIQANEWSTDLGDYIKPKYYISYTEKLEYIFKIQNKINKKMNLCFSEQYSSNTQYRSKEMAVSYQLMAVVRHMGDISGGHYVTYRRNGPHWFLLNDTQVEFTSFDKDVVPYVMIYEMLSK